ncbi:MAG: hypothetical protein N4A44_01830 [Alphaproteobacteria bacterium]|nr:hypothetical protein [Alphaproteobacteria bacterium]
MRNLKSNQNGSVVLEMLLGIALFIIVLPMLMGAIQERNKKLEEQAIASQINLIRESASNYLSANKDKEKDGSFVISEGSTIYVGTGSVGDDDNLSVLSGYGIKKENIEGILNGNSLGQTYHLILDKDTTNGLLTRGYLIVTKGDLSKLRLKRIVNRIGFSAAVVRTSPVGGGSCADATDYIRDVCVASSSGSLFQVPKDIYNAINSATYTDGENEFIMVALSDGDVVVSEFLYKDKTSSDNGIENTMLVNLNFSTSEQRDDNNLYDVYTANVEKITIDGTISETSYFETISTGSLSSSSTIGTSVQPVKTIENQAEDPVTISSLQNLNLGHIITQNLTFEGGFFEDISIDKEIAVEDLSLGSSSPMYIENLTMAEDENSTTFSDIGVENLGGYSTNSEDALIKLVGSGPTDNNITISGVNALELGGGQVGIVIQDTSTLDFDSDKDQLDIQEVARLNPGGDTNMVQDINLDVSSRVNVFTLTNAIYSSDCPVANNCKASAVFNALYDMQKAMQYAHFCFEKDRLQESVYDENCPLTRAEIVTIRDEIRSLEGSSSMSSMSTSIRNLKNAVTSINSDYWK